MESFIPPNKDDTDDGVESCAAESGVAECRDACSEESITNIVVTDDVSSFTTADDDCSAAGKCTESLSPYSYVQRGDYTSELYKLELMNLPKRFGIAVSKFLRRDAMLAWYMLSSCVCPSVCLSQLTSRHCT